MEKGLVNGAIGTVRQTNDLSNALVVQFDNCKGPLDAKDVGASDLVPILPTTAGFECNCADCTKILFLFPLRMFEAEWHLTF